MGANAIVACCARTFRWLLLATLLVSAGCGVHTPLSPSALNVGQPAGFAAEKLPPLPPAMAAPRRASSTGYQPLGEADVYASQNVSFVDDTAQFEYGQLGYVIFSLTPGQRIPERLDVQGYVNDLFVALADYDRGCWNFVRRDGLHRPTLLGLSDGLTAPSGSISSGGSFYILLLTNGYSEEIQALLLLRDSAGDNEPPTWVGGEGIKEAQYPGDGVDIYWHEAQDDSGVAWYVIYEAPAAWGIDWESPAAMIPGDTPELFAGNYFSEGYTHVAAVRAMDSVGNLTANTNTLEFTPEDTQEANQVLGTLAPGETIVASWSNPTSDLALYVGSSNGDEGDAFFGDEFAGRSFVVGPDNLSAGVAEEWVRLKPGAPGGFYWIALRREASGPDETVRVKIYRPDGSLRQSLGDMLYPGAAVGEIDYAELLCTLP